MGLRGNDVSFLPPQPEHSFSARTWALAALAVLLMLGIAAIATLRRSNANTGNICGADPYAANLPITGVTLSEATNGTGGKATYVDGSIANTGNKTVTSVLVQVTFSSTDSSAPYHETLPLMLVRTHVPYVDLQQIAANPVRPSEMREFRLIFESVPRSWDVRPPAIRVVHVDLK